MFERLIPPEFVALLPSPPQDYDQAIVDDMLRMCGKQSSREIIGYTFQLNDGVYYSSTYGVTIDRDKAYVYQSKTVEVVSRVGGWGNKSRGKFRAVYEEKSV